MSKLISISQSEREINTPNSVVKKIYDMITTKERYNGGVYDDDSSFRGTIVLDNPTYKEWADKVTEVFPRLVIESLYYMLFKDLNVEQIMLNYVTSKGVGDGHGITYDDAKNKLIVALPSFRWNTNIEYFNELQYFEKITTIPDVCFQGCTNLKEIDLSNITAFSGSQNFVGCTNLQKVILGNVSSLPFRCFNDCKNLEIVENTNNLTDLRNAAFYGCILLENIDVSNVQIFGAASFQQCTSLTNVNISNATSIEGDVFRNCTNLTLQSYVLPNLLTIGSSAFNGTPIPSFDAENCLSIAYNAFYECNRLTSINLPSCQTIENNVFFRCSSLTGDVNLPNLTTLGGNVFRETAIRSVVNLGNVTQLNGGVFRECKYLTTCNNALQNITSIGSEAFMSCTVLQSVGNLSNLTTIGANVFLGCSALTSFDFNTGITSIDNNAFQNCTSLIINDLNLPNLISLGTGVFKGTKLKTVSSLGNITTIPNHTFYDCKDLTSIANNALTNITSIGNETFRNCSSLTSINLSQNITSIGSYTFSGCTSLIINDLNLPNLTTIGSYVFAQTKLRNVITLGNITSLLDALFSDCSELINIGDLENNSNITYIGANCFSQCTSLQATFDFSNVTYIGGGAFRNCDIKAKRTAQGCIDLTSLEEIGGWTFSGTKNYLTGYIDFGSNFKKTYQGDYSGMDAHLIIRSPQVPTRGSSESWRYFNTKNGYYVYVLDSLINEYKTTFPTDAAVFKPISELPANLQ